MKFNGQILLRVFILSILSVQTCFGYLKLNFNKERNALCSKIKLLGIGIPAYFLRQHDNSGLLLEGDFQIHSVRWNDNLVCTFKVGFPTGTDGVIAVIQSLNMRRNYTSNQCIDFIQFGTKDASKSNPFCGHFNLGSKMSGESNIDFNFGNSFRTKRHKMYVHITFGKEPFENEFEKLYFKVVFSAYRNCSPETMNDLSYRPCSDKSSFCIYDGFFNDGYVNCPLPGCVDEGSCSKIIILEKIPTIGTKLLVSSLSFLCVLFITFLISIWACKKHKVACFSEHFSNPSRGRQERDTEMHEHRNTRTTQHATPSAPPIDADKDLPPKYEDLFPDR